MAPDDPDGAAVIARKIKHPWYRCQALSRAAEFSSGAKRTALLKAAIEAAHEQSEPNPIVTVACWPVAVMAEGSLTQAADVIRRACAEFCVTVVWVTAEEVAPRTGS
ncbi:Conserved hypothetical protein [Xanthomonas citri pv. fuscans]|nr:Conserved hypothetical protein [Xanthomonas citri pv. fuscans]